MRCVTAPGSTPTASTNQMCIRHGRKAMAKVMHVIGVRCCVWPHERQSETCLCTNRSINRNGFIPDSTLWIMTVVGDELLTLSDDTSAQRVRMTEDDRNVLFVLRIASGKSLEHSFTPSDHLSTFSELGNVLFRAQGWFWQNHRAKKRFRKLLTFRLSRPTHVGSCDGFGYGNLMVNWDRTTYRHLMKWKSKIILAAGGIPYKWRIMCR